jgi:Zn finger protein HypA/HybF involved in hydrogenase expression
MTAVEVVECTTCIRLFKDVEHDHVCPQGHRNDWVDGDDDYPVGQVSI